MSRNDAAPVPHSPVARLLLIGIVIAVLQVPACMIGQLGAERQRARDEAAAAIAAAWGGRQDLLGVYLLVPYRPRVQRNGNWELAADDCWIVVSPEDLAIDAQARVEVRRRGIFELPVYRAAVKLTGRFGPPGEARAEMGDGEPAWERARLVLRLPGTRAIDEAPELHWRGEPLELHPGSVLWGGAGLHAGLPALGPQRGGEFELHLGLRGSGGLHFVPGGRETQATLRADWPHPGFQGAWLPERRDTGPQGFEAAWTVPEAARGLPAAWKHGALSEDELAAARFGVDLLAPVDTYRMTERSIKYALLFIGLTFLAVWLLELRAGVRVHPVQYLLTGAALCLFYLLELSLAEHLGFGRAYALAAGAVTLQIAGYSRAVLGSWARAAAMAAVGATLYGLLYLLLREEDFALLVGSLALFFVLSAVMYLTRRIEWHPAG